MTERAAIVLRGVFLALAGVLGAGIGSWKLLAWCGVETVTAGGLGGGIGFLVGLGCVIATGYEVIELEQQQKAELDEAKTEILRLAQLLSDANRRNRERDS